MASHENQVVSKVGRPSRQEKDAAEGRIIAAATELFASNGFAGTSMEQVASRCGAGKDTVYRRFPSKVALFEAVVINAHTRAIKRVEQLTPVTGNALEQLRGLMFELLLINMEPDLIALKRITFSEAVVFGRSGPIPPQPDPLMQRVVDAISASQQAGMIADNDPRRLANHLIHCLVALPTSAAMMGSDAFRSRAAVEDHFEETWYWLINGLKP